MNELKVGCEVCTKNDTEFSVEVVKIDGSKVTVSYWNDGEKETTVLRRSLFTYNQGWDLPNYTIECSAGYSDEY
jgi:hypothetical protein